MRSTLKGIVRAEHNRREHLTVHGHGQHHDHQGGGGNARTGSAGCSPAHVGSLRVSTRLSTALVRGEFRLGRGVAFPQRIKPIFRKSQVTDEFGAVTIGAWRGGAGGQGQELEISGRAPWKRTLLSEGDRRGEI